MLTASRVQSACVSPSSWCRGPHPRKLRTQPPHAGPSDTGVPRSRVSRARLRRPSRRRCVMSAAFEDALRVLAREIACEVVSEWRAGESNMIDQSASPPGQAAPYRRGSIACVFGRASRACRRVRNRARVFCSCSCSCRTPRGFAIPAFGASSLATSVLRASDSSE